MSVYKKVYVALINTFYYFSGEYDKKEKIMLITP